MKSQKLPQSRYVNVESELKKITLKCFSKDTFSYRGGAFILLSLSQGAPPVFLPQAAAVEWPQCSATLPLLWPALAAEGPAQPSCSDQAQSMPCPPCVKNSLVFFLESPDGHLVTLGSVDILQLLTLHYALDGKFY